jgi:dienelactone hydrolase
MRTADIKLACVILPLVLLTFLISCRQQPAAVVAVPKAGDLTPGLPDTSQADETPPAVVAENALPTLENRAASSPTPRNTAMAPTTVVVPATAVPTIAASPSPPATETAVASATPDPYGPYTIASLAGRSYGGGALEIVERLELNERFARYLITYPSDGLTIYGFMNVPNEGSKFPVAIVLHGYVDPEAYETLAYTSRYADVLAEAGYFVIHPNLRGFPPSEGGEDAYRTGLAADVMNLIAIIRAQSSDPEGPLRRADPEAIHLWGHSMGGGVALRVATILDAPYLRAAVLYGAMSGDEKQNYEKILEWSGGNSGPFELAAPEETLQAISPIYHLERITAPISIHHGEGDETVPPEWSADLCARLEALGHPVECFSYHAAPHTFYGDWEELFNRRVIAFFERY